MYIVIHWNKECFTGSEWETSMSSEEIHPPLIIVSPNLIKLYLIYQWNIWQIRDSLLCIKFKLRLIMYSMDLSPNTNQFSLDFWTWTHWQACLVTWVCTTFAPLPMCRLLMSEMARPHCKGGTAFPFLSFVVRSLNFVPWGYLLLALPCERVMRDNCLDLKRDSGACLLSSRVIWRTRLWFRKDGKHSCVWSTRCEEIYLWLKSLHLQQFQQIRKSDDGWNTMQH